MDRVPGVRRCQLPACREACEWAWEAASDVLDDEVLEAAALAVLVDADRRLVLCGHDLYRTRRAFVLEGIARCHRASDDPAAA